MPLFPAFINLEDKKVLVIGGGEVAKRKVKNLLKFTRNITVVADRVDKELLKIIKEENLKLKKRKFRMNDLKDMDLVIVAVDNIKLQERVFKECKRRKILCNSVDSPDFCTFIFPSLIVRGDVVIGISTSGKVPALSKKLREIIEKVLPENLESILEEVYALRKSMKKGKKRQEKVIKKVSELLKD